VIGKFNQRASLLAKMQSGDGGGGYAESWTGYATVWAAVETAGGNDAYGPDANESRGKYRIILRRRGDVVAGQRVAIGARTFDIAVVQDEGPQTAFITLTCEEVP
jgi:SPP1 family predicted phage head-tail adaptor